MCGFEPHPPHTYTIALDARESAISRKEPTSIPAIFSLGGDLPAILELSKRRGEPKAHCLHHRVIGRVHAARFHDAPDDLTGCERLLGLAEQAVGQAAGLMPDRCMTARDRLDPNDTDLDVRPE